MSTSSPAERPLPKLDAFGEDFTAFHARFASLFARSEPRRKAVQYVRTLMGPVERRNGWQMAEAMGDRRPDAVQRLLCHATWSARDARDRLMDFSVEQFGDPEGIGILDDTGFIKKGSASVGVQRQYSGTAGKIENCQIGVFLGYDSERGQVLLDRALYLPTSWCEDAARRKAAHVPKGVRFHTKPELGLRMLRRAWRRGVPMAWITADEAYGDDGAFRAALDKAERRYVLCVSSSTKAWATVLNAVAAAEADRPRMGRPRTRFWLLPGVARPQSVKTIVASWPATQWHRLALQQGEKGPIEYDWACARVTERRKRRPARESWLLARRSIKNTAEVAYYLSNAGAATTLETLARVASRRYTIEQCFEEAKDDVGLDQYEVRTWPSWHRHVTLTMMALAWLASIRAKLRDPSSTLSCALEEQPAQLVPGKKAA
ncbi:Mobile element protein [Minicystis rosea]|nr:Mobile element protein [Minicystis rosea]APR75161.1 Mobile element protein [Minicystis rosea]APR80028.1 Mobile element protein [Minicystis rosea]APR80030.1 Mobile element protein [Minicystis rosea]APR80312.1 Mobile element protein [Minicystis rosea]